MIWVNRLLWPDAMIFITVDGESLTSRLEVDPHAEDGGEG